MGAIDMAVCRKVQKEFKSRGLGLKMDAMKAMAEFISNLMQDESELLQKIFAELERRTCEYVPSFAKKEDGCSKKFVNRSLESPVSNQHGYWSLEVIKSFALR
jgi:hypothetical protein